MYSYFRRNQREVFQGIKHKNKLIKSYKYLLTFISF